jgi:hypothetical protein
MAIIRERALTPAIDVGYNIIDSVGCIITFMVTFFIFELFRIFGQPPGQSLPQEFRWRFNGNCNHLDGRVGELLDEQFPIACSTFVVVLSSSHAILLVGRHHGIV